MGRWARPVVGSTDQYLVGLGAELVVVVAVAVVAADCGLEEKHRTDKAWSAVAGDDGDNDGLRCTTGSTLDSNMVMIGLTLIVRSVLAERIVGVGSTNQWSKKDHERVRRGRSRSSSNNNNSVINREYQ